MKLSELIKQLQEIEKEHGDIGVDVFQDRMRGDGMPSLPYPYEIRSVSIFYDLDSSKTVTINIPED